MNAFLARLCKEISEKMEDLDFAYDILLLSHTFLAWEKGQGTCIESFFQTRKCGGMQKGGQRCLPRQIFRKGWVNFSPPHPHDLCPLAFFLWGKVKIAAHSSKALTLEDLRLDSYS
jgi:hypothetical protein